MSRFSWFLLSLIIAFTLTAFATPPTRKPKRQTERDYHPVTKPMAVPLCDDEDVFAWVARETKQSVEDIATGKRSVADLRASNIAISRSIYGTRQSKS